MPKKRVHITYDKDKGDWKAQAEGAKKAQRRAETKEELVQDTTRTAKRQGETSVIIHKKEGKIQEERTYPRSSDPYPPEG